MANVEEGPIAVSHLAIHKEELECTEEQDLRFPWGPSTWAFSNLGEKLQNKTVLALTSGSLKTDHKRRHFMAAFEYWNIYIYSFCFLGNLSSTLNKKANRQGIIVLSEKCTAYQPPFKQKRATHPASIPLVYAVPLRFFTCIFCATIALTVWTSSICNRPQDLPTLYINFSIVNADVPFKSGTKHKLYTQIHQG